MEVLLMEVLLMEVLLVEVLRVDLRVAVFRGDALRRSAMGCSISKVLLGNKHASHLFRIAKMPEP
jgi:hypothetical protein